MSSWRKSANSRFNCSSCCSCFNAAWYLLSPAIALFPCFKLKSNAMLQAYTRTNMASSIRKNSGRPMPEARADRPQMAAPASRINADWRLLNMVDRGTLLCSFRIMPCMLIENSRTGRYIPKLERCPLTPIVEK